MNARRGSTSEVLKRNRSRELEVAPITGTVIPSAAPGYIRAVCNREGHQAPGSMAVFVAILVRNNLSGCRPGHGYTYVFPVQY